MENNSVETVTPDITEQEGDLKQKIQVYVRDNPLSTNTRLFSMMALLNAYVPKSYLLMKECLKVLGPPDPIHGGPPFEKRMEPFIKLIRKSNQDSDGLVVRLTDQETAQKYVQVLADLKISRSYTVQKCMVSLCGDEAQPSTVEFIRDLLTKREMGQNGKKDNFSLLITDIGGKERITQARSVMIKASNKFEQKHIFPQTVSRLFYIARDETDYRKQQEDYKQAEKWAKIAIRTAPNNSYAADTLGQVYKNRLRRNTRDVKKVKDISDKAFKAFKDVEKKAEREVGPELEEYAGTENVSNSFNNRGFFGFIQVAMVLSEKLQSNHCIEFRNQNRENRKREVKDKHEFFEWYLSYSKIDVTTLEPDYFWKDIANCYESYTGNDAADSTSFPGLLDRLNHGLFTSKERRAGFVMTEITAADLEDIRDELKAKLKAKHEKNDDDVKLAERFILSNIVLSNKLPYPPEPTLMGELQTIIHRFLETEQRNRSPEFYLLALMLFWPEERQTMSTEQQPPGLIADLNLQQYADFMEKAFDAQYSKYLRGRYLLPLFFLGKGSGLSKWIHKSRLDAIVENSVDAELDDEQRMSEINYMWSSGRVWHLHGIKHILRPAQTKPLFSSQNHEEEEEEEKVFVCVGRNEIPVCIESQADCSPENPAVFYLGFNIKGPVIFKVGDPRRDQCQ